MILSVPFTSQAPLGNWQDLRQEDGCEETSVLMVMRWVEDRILTPQEAEQEIIAISEYEQQNYGDFRETSIKDTAERILAGYFDYKNFEVRYSITSQDIKDELYKNRTVIVAVNGQKLANPFYTPPGPRDHMLVIRGYDNNTKEFIANDPGTRRGEGFRYHEATIDMALQDYPTGNHGPITEVVGAMISVTRPTELSSPN